MPGHICIARIGAPHGVRGAVKLWTFTEDPFAVQAYGPLLTKDGARSFEIATAREVKGHLVATLKGIATREDAERLNGIELYIAREKLPDTDENEYYHADLIGLAAVTSAGEPLGRVDALHAVDDRLRHRRGDDGPAVRPLRHRRADRDRRARPGCGRPRLAAAGTNRGWRL